MPSFKSSYSVRIFTIKTFKVIILFKHRSWFWINSLSTSYLERISIERRRVNTEWKFAENQETFRKVLKMRMCKVVMRLPCWCIYLLFLEMWKCECNTVSTEVRGAGICFLTWIQVYIQRYIILLRNGLSEKYREYSKGALVCSTPGENTIPLIAT